MPGLRQTNIGVLHKDYNLVELRDFVFFQEGPGLRKWQWTESGMKVINVTNILPDGSVDTSNTKRHISMEEFTDRYSHFAIEVDDVVVASSGNTYGKVGRVRHDHLPLMMNTSVIRFHPLDSEKLLPDYLYSFLRSPFFRNQVEQFVIGSAQPNFGPTHLKLMKLILPEVAIQRRIASILSAYDDLIENNTRRIAILEEMARRIYQEWFVHFRFPGHEKIKMVDSELGRIPKGWEVKSVSEVVHINPRTKLAKEGEKPFVPMANLSETSMLINDFMMKGGNSGAKFRNGDTLFARITPCLENGKTGYVNVLPDKQTVGFGSTEFVVMRSNTVCPEFVYLLARSEGLREHAIKSMSGASGRQRVRYECFSSYFIAEPDQDVLAHFREVVSPMFEMIRTLALKNNNLRTQRDLLLPKLISGEIDVSKFTNPSTEAAAA